MNSRDRHGGGLFRRRTAGASRSKPDLRPELTSLREPVFRQWFLSQILSSSGSMTQGVAVSWLVLTTLHGSGVDLGLMTSYSFLPWLVLGPLAGRVVDRLGPRRVLITTQTLLPLLSLLVAVLATTGTARIWMLFVIATTTGIVNAPDGAARQVYVVELVGTERLASAISLNEIVLNASRVLGPAAGAAALATAGVTACCLLNSASFLPLLAVMLRHRTARTAPAAGSGARISGLRYAWGNPTIRSCLVLAAASGMLFNLNVPVPLLATRVLHLGGGGFGLLMATFGLGAIPGALLAASGPAKPNSRTVALLAIGAGSAILATSYAPDVGMAFAGMAVTGFFSIWLISQANTLVQLEADPSMRGRLSAAWNMALPGCEPATSPFVGWVAGTAGARAGFGIALILAAATGWRGLTRPRHAGYRIVHPPGHHPIVVRPGHQPTARPGHHPI